MATFLLNAYSHLLFVGEPSAPKLEAMVQNQGNVLKVNWIKQDDGGSPIKHYLVRYKAVSILKLLSFFVFEVAYVFPCLYAICGFSDLRHLVVS